MQPSHWMSISGFIFYIFILFSLLISALIFVLFWWPNLSWYNGMRFIGFTVFKSITSLDGTVLKFNFHKHPLCFLVPDAGKLTFIIPSCLFGAAWRTTHVAQVILVKNRNGRPKSRMVCICCISEVAWAADKNVGSQSACEKGGPGSDVRRLRKFSVSYDIRRRATVWHLNDIGVGEYREQCSTFRLPLCLTLSMPFLHFWSHTHPPHSLARLKERWLRQVANLCAKPSRVITTQRKVCYKNK